MGVMKFQVTVEMQASFKRMNKILAADAICCYPDHDDIYNDDSDLQV